MIDTQLAATEIVCRFERRVEALMSAGQQKVTVKARCDGAPRTMVTAQAKISTREIVGKSAGRADIIVVRGTAAEHFDAPVRCFWKCPGCERRV